MPLQYSNTSGVGLSYILNLVGGVASNTPSGGREHERFTTQSLQSSAQLSQDLYEVEVLILKLAMIGCATA